MNLRTLTVEYTNNERLLKFIDLTKELKLKIKIKKKATNTNGYLFTIEIKNTTKERDLCLYKNSTKNFLISW